MSDNDSKPRVLVVDDEPLNRELLRRVLLREYEITEAEDGVQALELLEQVGGRVDLVLCDQLMPGMSGTELAERARASWPGLTFVLLTGYDDDPVVSEAQKSGLVSHVVGKPWRSSVLKQLIAECVEAVAAG